jgi:hypothetical protein
MSDEDEMAAFPDLEDLAFEIDVEKAKAMRRALQRARSAEDFQARWVAAADLLEQALDANLDDTELLDRFDRMTQRLATDVAIAEPELAAVWADSLFHLIGSTITAEVIRDRKPSDELQAKLHRLWFKRHIGVDLDEGEGS